MGVYRIYRDGGRWRRRGSSFGQLTQS